MTPELLEALAADARDGQVRLSAAEARGLAATLRRAQAQVALGREWVYRLLPCPATRDGKRTVLAWANEQARADFERAMAEVGVTAPTAPPRRARATARR